MAILRPNKPPLSASVDDFVWKKWFQDLYEVTKAGVVSPSLLSYSSGLQAQRVPKNLILNGDFGIWQRGTSFVCGAAASTYGPDRWCGGRGAVTGMAMSRTTGPTGLPYALRVQRIAGDTNANDTTIFYNMPTVDYNVVAGQSMTVSFWLNTGANYSGSLWQLRLFFGQGVDENRFTGFTNSITAYTFDIGPIPKVWTRYQYTFQALPAPYTQIGLGFSMRSVPAAAAGANDYWDLAAVQLETGPGTPFEAPPFDLNLARCRRFYQKSFPYATAPATAAGNAGVIQYYSKVAGAQPDIVMVYPNQVMRATPTLTFYNPGAANAKWRNLSAGADSGTAAASGASDSQFGISNPQVAGDGANALMAVHYTADAEM